MIFWGDFFNSPKEEECVEFDFFDYGDDLLAIEITSGNYKGLKYHYDKVSPILMDDNHLTLDFNFKIISHEGTIDLEDPDLRKIIEDILIRIVAKEI